MGMEPDQRPAIEARLDRIPRAAIGSGIELGHRLANSEREVVFAVQCGCPLRQKQRRVPAALPDSASPGRLSLGLVLGTYSSVGDRVSLSHARGGRLRNLPAARLG